MHLHKRLSFLILLVAGLMVGSCEKYDDSELWKKIYELESRVTNLENNLSSLNSDVKSIAAVVNSLQREDVYIISVIEIPGGFRITFSDKTTYDITSGKDGANGKDGKDGEDGKDGKDGKDGANGQDGTTPVISVKQYSDGIWYWTVNGEWLLDSNGKKIPVTGATPLLKVDAEGYWMVSYDGGIVYNYVLDANGKKIKAIPEEGSGCNCTSFFLSVTYENGYLILVLLDGTVINIAVDRDARIDNVVPPEVQEKITNYMTLYTGVNPPDVQGVYLISKFITVWCEDYGHGGYAPGKQVVDEIIRFSNQDFKLNTLDYDGVSSGSYESGKGAFISGEGNYFTAYFNTEGSTGDIYTKTALVISGEISTAGIKDLYYAFVMVEKGDDPDNELMEEGVYRVFKDEDGLSVPTNWPDETVAVTGVSLNKSSLTLGVGKSETLVATITPSNATDKSVSWKSSNSSVATVSSSGVVKGVAAGTATITVTTNDGGYKATCSVTVNIPVTSVSLSPSSLDMQVGQTYTLSATVYPSNATNKSISWKSSNSSIASVSSSGVVTAKATGTAKITVTTADGGYTSSCSVTVTQTSGYDWFLGYWRVSRGSYSDTWTISQKVKGSSYYITGIEGETGVSVLAEYDAENNAIVLNSQENITTMDISTNDGQRTCYVNLYGNIDYQGTIYYVTGYPYVIFRGYKNSSGSMTLSPGSVTVSIGDFDLCSFGFRYTYIYNTNTVYGLSNQTTLPQYAYPTSSSSAPAHQGKSGFSKSWKGITLERIGSAK